MALRGSTLTVLISLVCGLCFFVFGYSQGDIGGLLTVPAFLAQFPELDTINNPNSEHVAVIQGIAVAIWNIGCFCSALVTIFLGDILGRKKTILMGIVIWMIGEAIQASSFSFGQFLAGRFIAGFGNGFNTATVPAYMAECVKGHRKGTVLMISAGAFVAAGLALSYWLTFAFAYLDNDNAAWRVPIAFQCIFSLTAFIILVFLPESPRWLIMTGREEAALKTLSALNDLPEDDKEIKEEFLIIKDAILEMSIGGFHSLFSMGESRNFHRVVLAYFVQVFQQSTGINLVLQYLSLMFYQQFGYSGWLSRLLAGCAATEYFLASWIVVYGIDRFWGRRSLMLFGATGMCVSMVVVCIMAYLMQQHNVYAAHGVGVAFIFLFNTFFAIGWQGMAWLYQVEIVPLRIRAPANALSTSANWLVNFVIVLIAPVAFHNIGYRTYIIFACTNFVIVPLVYFYYPETAYRCLEEVDVLFSLASDSPKPWTDVVKISRNEPLWYGRNGAAPFDYSESDWHMRHVRFSNEGSSPSRSNDEKTTHSGSGSGSGSGDAATTLKGTPDDEKKAYGFTNGAGNGGGVFNEKDNYSDPHDNAGFNIGAVTGHSNENSRTRSMNSQTAHNAHNAPNAPPVSMNRYTNGDHDVEQGPGAVIVGAMPRRPSTSNQRESLPDNAIPRRSSSKGRTSVGSRGNGTHSRNPSSGSAIVSGPVGSAITSDRSEPDFHHHTHHGEGGGLRRTASGGRDTYYPDGVEDLTGLVRDDILPGSNRGSLTSEISDVTRVEQGTGYGHRSPVGSSDSDRPRSSGREREGRMVARGAGRGY